MSHSDSADIDQMTLADVNTILKSATGKSAEALKRSVLYLDHRNMIEDDYLKLKKSDPRYFFRRAVLHREFDASNDGILATVRQSQQYHLEEQKREAAKGRSLIKPPSPVSPPEREGKSTSRPLKRFRPSGEGTSSAMSDSRTKHDKGTAESRPSKRPRTDSGPKRHSKHRDMNPSSNATHKNPISPPGCTQAQSHQPRSIAGKESSRPLKKIREDEPTAAPQPPNDNNNKNNQLPSPPLSRPHKRPRTRAPSEPATATQSNPHLLVPRSPGSNPSPAHPKPSDFPVPVRRARHGVPTRVCLARRQRKISWPRPPGSVEKPRLRKASGLRAVCLVEDVDVQEKVLWEDTEEDEDVDALMVNVAGDTEEDEEEVVEELAKKAREDIADVHDEGTTNGPKDTEDEVINKPADAKEDEDVEPEDEQELEDLRERIRRTHKTLARLRAEYVTRCSSSNRAKRRRV